MIANVRTSLAVMGVKRISVRRELVCDDFVSEL